MEYSKGDAVPFIQEAGWTLVCAESGVATGIRSADLSVRSESLYRLSYPTTKSECNKVYC
jgi:hypothetical protein